MADSFGIDIGTYSIKLAHLKRGANSAEVEILAQEHNPVGQVVPAEEADFARLAAAIKKLVQREKIRGKSMFSGLPEGMVHSAMISMPNLSDAELASSIHWEAEQHIPMPLSEVNLEYELLYRPDKDDIAEKMRVMLVAARKDLVERMIGLLGEAGIELVGLETCLLGLYRALHPTLETEAAVMVCHMGALSTDILIVHNGELVLTYSIQSGGLALTRAIEQRLNLAPSQAEEYKRAYGLDPNQMEGKVREALSSVMYVLVQEIKKAVHYYQTSHQMAPVHTMWLSGGSAYLPALSDYMAAAMGIEVSLVKPESLVGFKKGFTMPPDIAAFLPVIGYAMQEE